MVLQDRTSALFQIGRPRFAEAADPIAYLYAEHYWHQLCCEALERLAGDTPGRDRGLRAALVLEFLESDMPAHCMDENGNLFPLLLRRCRRGDGAAEIVRWASFDAAGKTRLLASLLPGLRVMTKLREPDDIARFAEACSAFATLHRRQLAWENGYLLPLARKRLTAEDLYLLTKRLNIRHAAALLRRRRTEGATVTADTAADSIDGRIIDRSHRTGRLPHRAGISLWRGATANDPAAA